MPAARTAIQLHNLTDPAEVVRISAQHEVDFLPPEANDWATIP